MFDWRATLHASASRDLCLTLGYNTAVFGALLRFKGVQNLFNMDGIEWSRAKWGRFARAWLYLNEWAGCWIGNHLVADHPAIERHLSSRTRSSKITTIPYGADSIDDAPTQPVEALGLSPGRYATLIARAEPENSILEIVQGFSRQQRNFTLAVLGNYDVKGNAYHRAVHEAASAEVRFLGAIYEKPVVQALRFHSVIYIHGHQVGGTNPSLVEALGASNPIVAHENRFNRWVAGPTARYFSGADSFAIQIEQVLASEEMRATMREGSRSRFRENFTWARVLNQYEVLLQRHLLPFVRVDT